MDISVSKLLNKMDAELIEAKKAETNAKIREHVYAIKAICELILEESSTVKNVQVKPPTIPAPTVMQPIDVPKQKRLKEDDGANGDSLFDF